LLRITALRTTAKSHSSPTTGGPVREVLKWCLIPYWRIWRQLKCRPQRHFPMLIPMAAHCCFLFEGDRADETVLRAFLACPCHGCIPCPGCHGPSRLAFHCNFQRGNSMEPVPHMESASGSA